MYKVFVNKSIVFFAESGHLKDPDARPIQLNNDQISSVVQDIFNDPNAKRYVVVEDDARKAWVDFLRHFTLVEAAGGVVQNAQEEILWIKRLGMWDLPKGKLEKGESKEQCALREVREECGLNQLELGNALPTTYHYYFRDKPIIKPTYWFTMRAEVQQALKPQREEGITKVSWKSLSDSEACLASTYPSIAHMLRESGLVSS